MAITENLFFNPPSGAPDQPEATAELTRKLYRGFWRERLIPLRTETGALIPAHSRLQAAPDEWRWRDDLLPMTRRDDWPAALRRYQDARFSGGPHTCRRLPACGAAYGIVDGVSRLMRNELFWAREPGDLSRAGWLYRGSA